MLTKRDYEDAINVQDACNLSGVVQSWAKMVAKVWDEARAQNAGTQFVNEHPINVMYASKVSSLTGAGDSFQFFTAYEACQERIKEVA